MFLTPQIKRDIVDTALIMGVIIGSLYATALLTSMAMGIEMDSARPMVGSIAFVCGFLYLVKELITTFWKPLLSFTVVILLAGMYATAAELYIRYFTLLGIGELPRYFLEIYSAVIFAFMISTAYFVKRDFF